MHFVFDGRSSESPFVEMVWRTQTEGSGTFTSQAETRWEMVINKMNGETSLTMRGPETQATQADFSTSGEFFGIVFKTGTYMPHFPASKLMNRNDPILPQASSNSFWLLGSAWQFPSYDNADTFVARLIREGLLVRDHLVSGVLKGYQPDVSIRTVRRRFLGVTGMTYSEIRQINRASRAMTLLQQGTSILDTVHEAGYFDQPHLTKSLKHYMGQTPAQILAECQPVSLLYNTAS